MKKILSMRDEERLPLPSVLKLILPTLVELKLEDLSIESLQKLRTQGNRAFPPMKNPILLDACHGLPTARTPVFLVKSSGRYLPEFILLRQSKSYFDLCDNPFGSAEASVQPYFRYHPDGVMVFSDFLTLPRAFGKSFEMDTKKGGFCLNPMNSPLDIQTLTKINPNDPILSSFYNTIYLTRMALKGEAAVVGYSGGPLTIFAYMVEKSRSGLLETTKKWLYTQTEECHKILEFLTENIIVHIREQVRSGAQVIGIFEALADFGGEDFEFFSYWYIKKIAESVKKMFPNVPVVVSAKGQNAFFKKKLKEETTLPFDGLILDYNCDLEEMSDLCEKKQKILLGNLDSGVLMGSKKTIEEKTEKMITNGKKCKRFVAGVGQGIFEEIDPKNVEIFVEAIKNLKKDPKM